MPAVLNLPAGKFFFGYTYVPFDPVKAAKAQAKSKSASSQTASSAVDAAGAAAAAQDRDAFAGLSGGGNTLSGKRKAGESGTPGGSRSDAPDAHTLGKGKGKGRATETDAEAGGDEVEDSWAKLGGGNTLRPTAASRSANPAGAGAGAGSAASAATAAATATASAASAAQAEREIIDATMLDEDDFWEVPDDDDDDDVMEVYDSD